MDKIKTMNVCGDWFSIFKVPAVLNNENFIPNSNCLTCQPFGKVYRNTTIISKPPSQQIRTISSLVDKFTVGERVTQTNTKTSGTTVIFNDSIPSVLQTNNFNFKKTFNKHQQTTTCNRNRSFNIEMKHEKFTPCEPNGYYKNENHQEKNKIKTITSKINEQSSKNIILSNNKITRINNYEHPDIIVAVPPPRRKKRKTINRKQQNSENIIIINDNNNQQQQQQQKTDNSSTDISLDTIDKNYHDNLETRNNCRNIQLNNLDRSHKFIKNNYYENHNDDSNKFENNNNNNNNNSNIQSNNIFNNKIKSNHNNKNNNNKSGCSSVDVVSASLEQNNIILNQNINNNNNINKNNNHSKDNNIITNMKTTTNNLNDSNIEKDKNQQTMNTSNLIVGYSHNKVYYKDNNNKKIYENCSHCGKITNFHKIINNNNCNSDGDGGDNNKNYNCDDIISDIDEEILVCESIISFEQQDQSPPSLTSLSLLSSSSSSLPPPLPPPKNSTYTQFCTDSFYVDRDREDEISNSSFESQFEQINRLKSENSLLSASPFTKFRVRTKHQRTRHGSLIKDFNLLPSVHKTTTSVKAPVLMETMSKLKTTTAAITEGFYSLKPLSTFSTCTNSTEDIGNNCKSISFNE